MYQNCIKTLQACDAKQRLERPFFLFFLKMCVTKMKHRLGFEEPTLAGSITGPALDYVILCMRGLSEISWDDLCERFFFSLEGGERGERIEEWIWKERGERGD